jgi:hypothetical protein
MILGRSRPTGSRSHGPLQSLGQPSGQDAADRGFDRRCAGRSSFEHVLLVHSLAARPRSSVPITRWSVRTLLQHFPYAEEAGMRGWSIALTHRPQS